MSHKRSQAEVERRNVLKELVETEASYVDDLNLLLELFINPVRTTFKSRGWLASHLVNGVYSNLTVIKGVNEVLLSDLKELMDQPPVKQRVGKVFLKLADYLKMYTQYCGEQTNFLSTITDARRKERSFREWLDSVKFNDDRSRGLDIGQFLIKPVQRVCKYPLMLGQLIKYTPEWHPDYEELEQANRKMDAVVQVINEGRKQLETFHKMTEIQLEMERALGKDFVLLRSNRHFVREGDFFKIGPNGKGMSQHVYLFNDLLIYGKLLNKGKPTKRFKYKGHMYLGKVLIRDVPADEPLPGSEKFAKECAFQILRLDGKSNKLYTLVAATKEEKFLWQRELSEFVGQIRARQKVRRQSVGTSSQSDDGPVRRKKGPVVTKDMRVAAWEARAAQLSIREMEQRAMEQQLRAEYELDDETDELDDIHVPQDGASIAKFAQMDPTMVDTFTQLSTTVHSLELSRVPVFVVLGMRGAGKSSLVEALVGFPLFAKSVHTRHTVTYRLRNQCNAKTPRVTLIVDGHASVVDVEDVRQRLAALHAADVPLETTSITVQYEHCSAWNVDIIDTPGLDFLSEDVDVVAQSIARAAQPAHRFLLAVEPAQDWQTVELLPFVRGRLDPLLQRTRFVWSKWSLHMSLLVCSADERAYFDQCPVAAHSAWLSLLSPTVHPTSVSDGALQQRLCQVNALDLQRANSLDFDQRWAKQIGWHALQRWALNAAVDHYMDHMFSAVPAALSTRVHESEVALAALHAQVTEVGSVDAPNMSTLRSATTVYLHRFHTLAQSLISGNVAASLGGSMGASLCDERSSAPVGAWAPAPYATRSNGGDTDDATSVLFAGCLIGPGGAQVQRVLSEFTEVASNLKLSLPPSAFVPAPDRMAHRTMAVELARKNFNHLFGAALSHLCDRLLSILQGIGQLAASVLRNDVASSRVGTAYPLGAFSSLDFLARRLFNEAVLHRLSAFKQWCSCELLASRVTQLPVKSISNGGVSSFEESLHCFLFKSHSAQDFLAALRTGAIDRAKPPSSLKRAGALLTVEEQHERTVEKMQTEAEEAFDYMKKDAMQSALLRLSEVVLSVLTESNQLQGYLQSSVVTMSDAEVCQMFDLRRLHQELSAHVQRMETQVEQDQQCSTSFLSRVHGLHLPLRKSIV